MSVASVMITADSTVKRLRVTFLRKDNQYLYVQSNEPMAEEPLRVRYAVVDVNAEFNDTVALLWPQAQLNLLDEALMRQVPSYLNLSY